MTSTRPTFLVADDQPALLELTVSLLTDFPSNPRIFKARNGEHAVRMAIEHQPEVIIMDWEMPVMDGLEATRRIAAEPATAGTPILMFTANRTTPRNLRTALEAGATDFIRKPAEGTELRARVNAALRLSRAMREVTRKNAELVRVNGELMTAIEEVQTLSSLLPICSHCKQIRDDSGEWQPMESYIQTHTGSQFSHGLCNPCMVEHYPDFADG